MVTKAKAKKVVRVVKNNVEEEEGVDHMQEDADPMKEEEEDEEDVGGFDAQ